MADTISVFVPVGMISKKKTQNSASRQVDQSNIVVGLLDNHKHGSTRILNRLQQRLSDQFEGVRFVWHKKADAGMGASSKIIENLAKECAVVVNGVAD
jgi:hypothetical protein